MISDKFIDFKTYRNFQVLANLIFLLIWYFANDGLAFWDDYTYVNFANQINQGGFEITNNHFTSRIGLLYPVAWTIELFGINELSITVFPMLCGLVILNILFWIGSRTGHWVGLLSGLLFLVDYHTITFITHLFPEIPIAVGVFGGLFCYDFVNRREGDYRLLALLMSLLLFGAFLIKTSIFIVVPLFVYLFVNDFRRRRNKGFWYISLGLLLFFFLIHGFWYKELHGDFFYRFNNISDNHEPTVKTFFDKGNVDILKRLTYLPFLGFLRGGFFIPLGFALPAFFVLKRGDWRLDKPEKLWPVAAVLILTSWWFISTNWKYYSPMPVDTRHITFLIPILILSGAYFWSDNKWFVSIRSSNLKLVLIAALFVIPSYKIFKSGDRNFSELQEVITSEFVRNNTKERVITDGLVSYGYPYFYAFEETKDEYVWWVELDFEQIQVGDFLLVNENYLNDRYEEPGYLSLLRNSINSKGWELDIVYDGNVELYRIID